MACGALKPGGRVGATSATRELAGTNGVGDPKKKLQRKPKNRMTRHRNKEGEPVGSSVDANYGRDEAGKKGSRETMGVGSPLR